MAGKRVEFPGYHHYGHLGARSCSTSTVFPRKDEMVNRRRGTSGHEDKIKHDLHPISIQPIGPEKTLSLMLEKGIDAMISA
jgi:hypothetical protein